VPCESENGKQFMFMLCDKPKHVVTEAFIDAYKNTYYEGDELIQGCYYNLLQLGNKTYYFNDDAPLAYIYSHLICASKFAMPPTSHSVKGSYPTFELPNETLHLTEKALEDLRHLDVEF